MNVVKVCFILPLLESRDSPLYKDSCSIVQAVDSWMAMRDSAESTQTDFKFVLCISRFDISQSRNDFVDAIKSLINEGVSAFAVLGDPAMAELAAYLNGTNSTIPIFVIACRHSYVYEHVFYVWRDADTIACRIAQSLVAEKCKRIALLTDSGAYGLDYLESFERLSVTYGLNIDSSFFNAHSRDKYRFPFSESDEAFSRFETTLSDLLSKEKWDAIVILGYGTGFNRCFNTILAKLPDAKIYTDHFFTYPQGCNGNNVFAPCIRLDDERICSYRAEWHKTRMTFRCVGHAKESESCLPDPKSDVLVSRSVSGNDSVNAAGACEARALKTLIGSTLDILAEAVERCRGGGDLSSALFGIKHLETFVGPVLLQNCEGACFQIAIKNKSEQDKLQLEIYDNSSIAYLLQTIDDSAKTIDINVVRKGVEKGRIVGRLREIYDSIFQPAMTRFNLDFVSAFDSIGSSEFGCVYTLNQVADSMLGDMEHVLSLHVLDALDGPLQINAHDDDVEQNDAIRIFVVGQSGKCTHKILSLVYYKALMAEEKAPEIVGLVLARSSRAAKCLWSRHGCECLGGVKEETPVITELHSDDGRLTSVSERIPLVDVADFVRTCVTWARYLYVVPTGSGTTASFGTKVRSGYVVVSAQKLRAGKRLGYFPLIMLDTIISRAFSSLYSGLAILRIEAASTRSAIGSIMSRNGSHNIGSHVLAALSHNVGTMPDDRVLYQYIQHRMDYIATATTGFPDWGVPTMFVGEIMRNFMMQHHLLDHIVESEGLHAYHFQGHNACSEQNESNALRIRIEVDVGKNEKPNTYQFISYPDDDKPMIADVLRSDVCVAIPGGVAGHHAIYTIIENVIRNSAKHGWANSNHEKQKNLEITIRFRDDPSRNRVVFTIFDNTPQGENLDELVGDLNGKLDEKLISESSDGGLRQENWGLAEMRISASFFQQRTLGETGGIEKLAEDGDYIIRAVPVENNGNRYLGYEFHVAKPREMLFAIPYSEEWEEIKERFSSQPDLVRKLGCVGIHVVFQHDAGADDYREFVTNQQSKEHERVMEWEYEYVILPQEPEDVRTGVYPFRMLVLSESKDGDFVWDKIPSYVDEPIGSKKIPSLHDLQDRLCELFGKVVRMEDVDSNVCAIKKLIRLRWLLYFEKRTRPVALLEDGKLVDCGARDIRMLIDTDGQSSGQSGQGLISDYDVCAYIFEHVFSSLLDEIGESMASAKRLKEILKERKITPLSCFESVVNAGADGQTMRLERRKEVFGDAIDLMLDKLDKVKDQKKFEPDENLRNVLVDHLVGAFPTAHALLRKYAEKIDTLPENFCENTFSSGGERKDLSYSDDDGDFEGTLTLRRRAVGDKFPPELGPKFTITYCRHGDIDDRDIYRSGLSGSQAGFSQFQHMEYASGEDYSPDRQLADFSHLVEDALSRVLVIDERICKFLTSRRRIAKKLSWMNVWAVDTDMGKKFEKKQGSMVVDGGAHDMESCLRLDWDEFKECSQGEKVKDKKAFSSIFPCGKYDVLIIHQGIIDKLLGDQCTSENVAIFLTALKEQIPYVVITTGRGRPANTPRTARILPFPCVERYLFQEWPEKFLLINTIMNLLPCGGIKGVE